MQSITDVVTSRARCCLVIRATSPIVCALWQELGYVAAKCANAVENRLKTRDAHQSKTNSRLSLTGQVWSRGRKLSSAISLPLHTCTTCKAKQADACGIGWRQYSLNVECSYWLHGVHGSSLYTTRNEFISQGSKTLVSLLKSMSLQIDGQAGDVATDNSASLVTRCPQGFWMTHRYTSESLASTSSSMNIGVVTPETPLPSRSVTPFLSLCIKGNE